MGDAAKTLDAARREAEIANAKLEVVGKQARSLGRMANSAIASSKRSIDNIMKANVELGVDNEEHTAIRAEINAMSTVEVKDELAKYPGARLTGSDAVLKHRLQLLKCGEAIPVEPEDENAEEGPTPTTIANELISKELTLIKQKADLDKQLKGVRQAQKANTITEKVGSKALDVNQMKEVFKDHAPFDEPIEKIQNNAFMITICGEEWEEKCHANPTPGMPHLVQVVSTQAGVEGACLMRRLEIGGIRQKQMVGVYNYDTITGLKIVDKKAVAEIMANLQALTQNTPASTQPSSMLSTPRGEADTSQSSGTGGPRDALGRSEEQLIATAVDNSREDLKRQIAEIDAALADNDIDVVGKRGTKITGGNRTSFLKRRRTELEDQFNS